MKRLTALVLACALLVPACAFALTGQNYTAFDESYKANVAFINENDNRHLLPMVLSQRKSQENDGRMYYDLVGEVLNVIVTVDSTGVIEECEIRLTAPTGLEYGSSDYNDFAISGYHSYAFLMAMDTNTDPAKRYELVTDVVQGMKDSNGAYTRQLGAYTLTCTRVDNTAVLNFFNNGVQVATPTPDTHTTPAPGDNPATAAPSDDPASADDFVG